MCVRAVIRKRENVTEPDILFLSLDIRCSEQCGSDTQRVWLFFAAFSSLFRSVSFDTIATVQMCNVQLLDNNDAAEKLDFYFNPKMTEKKTSVKK